VRDSVGILLLSLTTAAAAQQHHEAPGPPTVLAPGYSTLEFPAPIAGSYSLPTLGKAADGTLLDSAGEPVALHSLYDGKTVVLSFVYTTCPDVNGCPLATFVLARVLERLASDASLKDKVRLITVSFDPVNDTPEVMTRYAGNFRRGDIDWKFLTADSEASLDPVLDDYDQLVIRTRDAQGKPSGALSHILRVYLIDEQKNIRNIYSPSFLHPDLLLADIKTVMKQ
jgi:cytochrome c peroxidase